MVRDVGWSSTICSRSWLTLLNCSYFCRRKDCQGVNLVSTAVLVVQQQSARAAPAVFTVCLFAVGHKLTLTDYRNRRRSENDGAEHGTWQRCRLFLPLPLFFVAFEMTYPLVSETYFEFTGLDISLLEQHVLIAAMARSSNAACAMDHEAGTAIVDPQRIRVRVLRVRS